jgi:hypothetical protein
MTSEGIFEDTKQELKRRLKSPFAGSYALAWCVVNYEFLIVVFSAGPYADKIGYIAQHIYYGRSWWDTFGLPALLALIPVLGLPVLNLLADLWSKMVDVSGTYLIVWMETKKRVSDPELRALALSRSLEINTLRNYAKEALAACAQLALYRATALNPGMAGWVQLPDSDKSLIQGVPAVIAKFIHRAGFPSAGHKMLQCIFNEGPRTEGQLIDCCDPGLSKQDKLEIVALLLGAGLTSLKWFDGVQPSFDLTQQGRDFNKFINTCHPGAFAE